MHGDHPRGRKFTILATICRSHSKVGVWYLEGQDWTSKLGVLETDADAPLVKADESPVHSQRLALRRPAESFGSNVMLGLDTFIMAGALRSCQAGYVETVRFAVKGSTGCMESIKAAMHAQKPYPMIRP